MIKNVEGLKAFYGIHVPPEGNDVPVLQTANVISEGNTNYAIHGIAAFGYRTWVPKSVLQSQPDMFPTSERDAWEVFARDKKRDVEKSLLHLGVAEAALEALDAEEAHVEHVREASKRC